ncbi:MAG: hypothetical protein ACOCWM_05335 [Cyclobacteriaceae bacterium]
MANQLLKSSNSIGFKAQLNTMKDRGLENPLRMFKIENLENPTPNRVLNLVGLSLVKSVLWRRVIPPDLKKMIIPLPFFTCLCLLLLCVGCFLKNKVPAKQNFPIQENPRFPVPNHTNVKKCFYGLATIPIPR